ncbi:MAG: flippase [Candidatus Micrarchaeota archaeon]
MDGDIPEHSREVARGSFWSLAGTGVFHLISFFYVILVARTVSQDDLGLFFLAFSILSMAAVFDNLGLGSAMARYVPYFEGRNEHGKIRSMLRTGYILVTASGAIFGAAFWMLADVFGAIYQEPRLPDALRFLAAYLLVSNVLGQSIAFLRGRRDIRGMQAVQNMQHLLKLVLTLALIYLYGPTLAAISAGFMLSFAVSALVSLYFVRRNAAGLPPGAGSISPEQYVRDIIPYGLTMSLTLSLGAVFFSVGRMLLAYLVDPSISTEIIAIYSVSFTLASVLLSLPTAIGTIFLPTMSRLFGKGDIAGMRSLTETVQRWTLFITTPPAVVMSAFSEGILAALYGDSYRAGSLVLSILAITILVRLASYMVSQALSSMRLVTIQLSRIVAMGLLELTLYLVLIPRFGMAGAAMSSFVATILYTGLMMRLAKKHFGFEYSAGLLKLGLAGALTFAVLYLLAPFSLPLSSAVGALGESYGPLARALYLAYFGLLVMLAVGFFAALSLALKCILPEDVAVMKKVLQKARVPGALIALAERVASLGVHKA